MLFWESSLRNIGHRLLGNQQSLLGFCSLPRLHTLFPARLLLLSLLWTWTCELTSMCCIWCPVCPWIKRPVWKDDGWCPGNCGPPNAGTWRLSPRVFTAFLFSVLLPCWSLKQTLCRAENAQQGESGPALLQVGVNFINVALHSKELSGGSTFKCCQFSGRPTHLLNWPLHSSVTPSTYTHMHRHALGPSGSPDAARIWSLAMIYIHKFACCPSGKGNGKDSCE